MKVLTFEETITVRPRPRTAIAGVTQNISGHQVGVGNQMRPTIGQDAALTTTA
ncbi:hypothetical protein D3C78_1898070 [compost metagenome]